MVISHKKKFIFIHVQKTGGTSIRNALKPYIFYRTPLNRVKGVLGVHPRIYYGEYNVHIKAKDLKDKMPSKIFEDYYKFGFVRNPWDWMVSWYFFIRGWDGHRDHQLVMEMDFSEFLDWRLDQGFYTQSDFLYDAEGNLLVDYIGRFEHLHQDFQKVCTTLGLNKAALPHSNSTVHRSYREYYDQCHKNKVDDFFCSDIKNFSYDF